MSVKQLARLDGDERRSLQSLTEKAINAHWLILQDLTPGKLDRVPDTLGNSGRCFLPGFQGVD